MFKCENNSVKTVSKIEIFVVNVDSFIQRTDFLSLLIVTYTIIRTFKVTLVQIKKNKMLNIRQSKQQQ